MVQAGTIFIKIEDEKDNSNIGYAYVIGKSNDTSK